MQTSCSCRCLTRVQIEMPRNYHASTEWELCDDTTIATGNAVWTDGTNIFYSYDGTNLVLNNGIWETKTWDGYTQIFGGRIWTDGTDIYFSEGSTQYVLVGSAWTAKSWSGLSNFYGDRVWTDGANIYYSKDAAQYVLDSGIWVSKTWEGYTTPFQFGGDYIWTDGTDIYLSASSSKQAVLEDGVWIQKTWDGDAPRTGNDIWTNGEKIYWSYNSNQTVLENGTWNTMDWDNRPPLLSGSSLWTDGKDIYSSFYYTPDDSHLTYKLKRRRLVPQLIITDSNNYTAIADAIRAKTNTETLFTPSQMAQAILDIQGSQYIIGAPVKFTLEASRWDGHSYALSSTEYKIGANGLQIGVPNNESGVNTSEVIRSALSINFSRNNSEKKNNVDVITGMTMRISCVNVPTVDIIIALFGLEPIANE